MSEISGLPAALDRIIVEHVDPENLVPGGIDTCIHDLIKYGDDFRFGLVGITLNKAHKVGVWTKVELAGRDVEFMPVARFDRSETSGSRVRVPHSMRLLWGVVRYNRRIPRVLLQAHRVETGFLLSYLRRSRFIQFIHNDSNGLTGAHSDSSWKGLGSVYRALEKRVLRRAAGIVVFNRTDGTRLVQARPDVYVAQTWFDPQVYQRANRVKWDGKRALRVCWVGRLESQKDPLLAVDTISQLLKRVPSAELVMVGDGSMRDGVIGHAAELGVSESVHLLGSQDRATVAKVMSESDCLLMTSHYEGSPRVLVEAGGTGLPVVATKGADPDGALEVGSNGIATEQRDPALLATGLIEACQYSEEDCCTAAEHRAAGPSVKRILSIGVA